MQHSITTEISPENISDAKVITHQSVLLQIFGATILAIAMLYGVGFASMDLAHNAAHDTRHAIAFPCH